MTCRQMIYCFLFYSVVLCSICFPESSFMNLTSLSYGDSDNRIEVNKTNMGVSLSEENYPETFTDKTRLTTSNLSTDISTHRETQGNVNRSEFELLKTEDEHVMLKEMDNNQTIREKDSIRKTTELPALLNLSTTSADTTEEALVNESNKISYTNSTSSQTEVVSNSYKDFSEKSVDEATFESRDTKFNPMVNSTIPWDMTKANTQKSVRHEKFSGTAKLLTTTPKHHRHKPYRHSYHQMLHHKTMHHLSLVPIEDGPFGSLVWKDKKYLISVLIPIAIGIIGAVCIIAMTYTARFCHKYEAKLKDMKASVSRQAQPCTDQITLLSDSDEV